MPAHISMASAIYTRSSDLHPSTFTFTSSIAAVHQRGRWLVNLQQNMSQEAFLTQLPSSNAAGSTARTGCPLTAGAINARPERGGRKLLL